MADEDRRRRLRLLTNGCALHRDTHGARAHSGTFCVARIYMVTVTRLWNACFCGTYQAARQPHL